MHKLTYLTLSAAILICSSAYAAPVDCDIPDGVTGIYTPQDLLDVNNDLSGRYKLCDDIDLSGINFKPIGVDAVPPADAPPDARPFTGVFDGNGKRISNLTIRPSLQNSFAPVGLFGRIFKGIVKNLEIVRADVTGRATVGVLAGSIERGKLTGISIKTSRASVPARDGGSGEVGLLAGSNIFSIIRGVDVEGDVQGFFSVGGLIGSSYGGLTASQANVLGRVSGLNPSLADAFTGNLGGIIGQVQGKLNISQCSFDGDVSGFAKFAGGIIGLAANTESFLVSQCSASGLVRNIAPAIIYGVTSLPVAAGLIGQLQGGGQVRNCLSDNSVEGPIAAGLMGIMGSGAMVDRALSLGNVTKRASNNPALPSFANGLIGIAEKGSRVLNSFFNSSINQGLPSDLFNPGRTGDTLMRISTFRRWDISSESSREVSIWKIAQPDGTGFPHM